jgi:phage/plasmid primase-like uncharacterized protein
MANPASDALTPDELREAFRELSKATTEEFLTCPGCGKRHGFQVPDRNTRIKAIQLALEHGYGKPATSKTEDHAINLDVDVTKLNTEQRTQTRQAILRAMPDLAAITRVTPV